MTDSAATDLNLTLEGLTARASQLYSLPAVAMKVVELTNNPQVDTRALKACIENDPALTGKILRVVNSSLFGLSRGVSDLNQALALLGTKPLKMLVLGFSLPGGLFEGLSGDILGRYWRHALTKAVAAREISETVFNTPGDEAFIAGLLQDLGVLLLIQEVGQPYIRFLEKVYADGGDMAALERESMGFDHTTLTARLLTHWGLPETLVEAVAWHTTHDATAAPPVGEHDLPRILYLAELLSRLLGGKRPELLRELLTAAAQFSAGAEEKLQVLVDNLQEKVGQLADVLSLQLPEGRDYRDVLIEAHAQLARVAGDAAGEMLGRSHGGDARCEQSLSSELECLAQAVADVSRRPPDAPRPAPLPASAPAAAAAPAAPAKTSPAPGVREIDPGLLGQLAAAVASCRQQRCPLSLLLIELDQADSLALTLGPDGFRRLGDSLRAMCRSVDHYGAVCLEYGEAGLAVILPDCERRQAVEWGNQLIADTRRLLPGAAARNSRGASLSVGAATVSMPPRNFPPHDLFTSAERCLYGSHVSGGGVVKSIEIY